MSKNFIILAAIGLVILLLLYRTSSQVAAEGFANLPQPDLCSDLNATDCQKAAGCAYCAASGLCLNESKAILCTNAYLVKDIVDGMTDMPTEPMASNSFPTTEETA